MPNSFVVAHSVVDIRIYVYVHVDLHVDICVDICVYVVIDGKPYLWK